MTDKTPNDKPQHPEHPEAPPADPGKPEPDPRPQDDTGGVPEDPGKSGGHP